MGVQKVVILYKSICIQIVEMGYNFGWCVVLVKYHESV